MNIQAINKQQNISFESKILRTNVLGFGFNRAIELGDKGFFNAIKHLANDGLSREILIGGSNTTTRRFVSATATLETSDIEYSLSCWKFKKPNFDGFNLMGENVIELVKKLASETGNISKKVLKEKATPDELVRDCNKIYETILIG